MSVYLLKEIEADNLRLGNRLQEDRKRKFEEDYENMEPAVDPSTYFPVPPCVVISVPFSKERDRFVG